MKKIFITIIAMLLPLLASAEIITVDGIKYSINFLYEAEVVNSYEYSGNITIPPSFMYNGESYVVKKIGKYAFQGSTDLISVVIPNCVTAIGENAFYQCSGLKSVNIPNGVKTIENYVFGSCSSLTKMTIPHGVISIGECAFYGCTGLTSLTIPTSVTHIENGAFQNCYNLSSINIPNSVISIGIYAFCWCKALSSITIGKNVQYIGRNAFQSCINLSSVNVSNSVYNIESLAFSSTPWYEDQPAGLVYAGKVAYKYKGNLPPRGTHIKIDEGTIGISSMAFYNYSNFTSVTIPSSVTFIGNDAFYNCSDLKDVYCMAEDLPIVLEDAFRACNLGSISLHVPSKSVAAYRSEAPWCNFKEVIALPKCSKPTIVRDDNQFEFTCETADVKYVYEISENTHTTITDNTQNKMIFKPQIYSISVYATKDGYENSDKASLDFKAPSKLGDLNDDGKVDVADHVKLSDIILNRYK